MLAAHTLPHMCLCLLLAAWFCSSGLCVLTVLINASLLKYGTVFHLLFFFYDFLFCFLKMACFFFKLESFPLKMYFCLQLCVYVDLSEGMYVRMKAPEASGCQTLWS